MRQGIDHHTYIFAFHLPDQFGLGRADLQWHRRNSFRGSVQSIDDITFLSFEVTTTGALFDNGVRIPLDYQFSYDLGDLLEVTDLKIEGNSITGSLQFGPKPASGGGAVTIGGAGFGGLRLDFTTGVAEGFCFSSLVPEAECVWGGGTSTSIEARIEATKVPLPSAFVLLCSAIIALLHWGTPRNRRHGAFEQALPATGWNLLRTRPWAAPPVPLPGAGNVSPAGAVCERYDTLAMDTGEHGCAGACAGAVWAGGRSGCQTRPLGWAVVGFFRSGSADRATRVRHAKHFSLAPDPAQSGGDMMSRLCYALDAPVFPGAARVDDRSRLFLLTL